jgi:hypothetical protein
MSTKRRKVCIGKNHEGHNVIEDAIEAADLEFENPVKFPDGSVSAPSITFTDDTNTGVFTDAADELAITCGGTEIARFNAAGLEFEGNGSAAAPAIQFTNGGTEQTGFYRANLDQIAFTGSGSRTLTIAPSFNSFVGTCRLPLGTKTLPSMHFEGRTDTGVYSSAADTIDVSANDTRIWTGTDTALTSRVPHTMADVTDASSKTSGSLIVSGGIGCAKSFYCNRIDVNGTYSIDPAGVQSGELIYNETNKTGAGAIAITEPVAGLNTTGSASNAFTVADGTTGQVLIVYYEGESNSAEDCAITPATKTGFTTVTLNDPGDSVTFFSVDDGDTTGWIILATNGGTIS